MFIYFRFIQGYLRQQNDRLWVRIPVPKGAEIILFATRFRPTLGHTQPPVGPKENEHRFSLTRSQQPVQPNWAKIYHTSDLRNHSMIGRWEYADLVQTGSGKSWKGPCLFRQHKLVKMDTTIQDYCWPKEVHATRFKVREKFNIFWDHKLLFRCMKWDPCAWSL
jgi:hypothetical protein